MTDSINRIVEDVEDDEFDSRTFTKYSSIDQGSRAGERDWVANSHWFIQEKIDGSQLSFCKPENDSVVHFYCKGKEKQGKDALFQKVINVVGLLAERLNPFYVYHAEYVSKPRHNVVVYHRMPPSFAILYDITDVRDGHALMPNEIQEEGTRLGLEVTALLYDNTVDTDATLNAIDKAKELIEQILAGKIQSCLGGNPEGVVLKCHNFIRQPTHPEGKVRVSNTKLKFVTPSFTEQHTVKQPKVKTTVLPPSQFLAWLGLQYNTDARLRKGLQRMRDLHGRIDVDSSDYMTALEQDLDADLLKEHGTVLRITIESEFKRWIGAWRNITRAPQAVSKIQANVLEDPVFQALKNGASADLMVEHLVIVCAAARQDLKNVVATWQE